MINNPNNRVVVTGIGILCSLGLDTSTTWEGLTAGKFGIDYITLFDPEPLDTKFAGEIKGFDCLLEKWKSLGNGRRKMTVFRS